MEGETQYVVDDFTKASGKGHGYRMHCKAGRDLPGKIRIFQTESQHMDLIAFLSKLSENELHSYGYRRIPI